MPPSLATSQYPGGTGADRTWVWLAEPMVSPAAVQADGPTHETPASSASDPPTAGASGTRYQVPPFHCATRLEVVLPSVDDPTAVQVVDVAHDTPTKASKSAGLESGLATIDQVVPFPDSTRVCHTELTTAWPTAVQVPAIGHDTEPRTLVAAVDGSG